MRMARDHWIILGIFGVIMLVFVCLVYMPQDRRLTDLNSQGRQLAQELSQNSAKAACVPEVIRQVESQKREFQNFDRRLPKQKELAEFLKEISSTALSNHLDNQVIEPGNPTRGPLYNRLPIIMRFDSNFTGLTNFLRQIDGMERLTRVEKIHIAPATEGSALHVEMVMNIYFTES